jgi:cytochrome c oxidase subunit 1
MAFMGATYYLIPLVFRRKVALWPLAKIQPYLFAGGMLLFTMAMTFAGSFGVPRRHWDISFTNAAFDVQFSPAVDVLLALVAVGGLVAATGAFVFIAIAVKSVFFGEPLGEVVRGRHQAGIPQGLTHPPTHAPNVDELNAALHAPGRGIFGPAPGTLALVGVFLLAFVLYYFVNWKVLSFVWKIG